jgi:hypothetical protein
MAWLVVAFVMVAGATFSGASPAQAASWTDCPSSQVDASGFVCLWENPNYTGGRWQAAKSTLFGGASGGIGGCYNLNGSRYTNGGTVYDTASSWAIRSYNGDTDRFGFGFSVTFYEWINCNAAGKHRLYDSDQDFAVSDLSTLTPNWNNTVASILVEGWPACQCP